MSLIHFLNNHKTIKISLITISVLLVFLSLLPFFVQWGIEYELKQRGANQAQVEDININLFKGTFEVNQMSAVFDKQPAMRIKQLLLTISIRDLFKSRFVVEDLMIDDLNLELEKNNDGGLIVNGYHIPVSQEEKIKDEKAETTEPLAFAVHSAQIKNSRITYLEQDFKQQLAIEKVSLQNVVSWMPESQASLVLAVSENEAKIAANLNAQLFTEDQKINGDVSVKSLSAEGYKKFYQPFIKRVNTQLDVALAIDVVFNNALTGTIKHDMTFHHVDTAYQEIEFAAKKISSIGLTVLENGQVQIDNTSNIEVSQLKGQHTLPIKQLKLDDLNLTLKGHFTIGDELNGKINHQLMVNQFSTELDAINYSADSFSFSGNTDLNGEKLLATTNLTSKNNVMQGIQEGLPKVLRFNHLASTFETDLKIKDVLHGKLSHKVLIDDFKSDLEQFSYTAQSIETAGKTKINATTYTSNTNLILDQSVISSELENMPKNAALERLALDLDGEFDVGESLNGLISHQIVLQQLSAELKQLAYTSNQIASKGQTKIADGKVSIGSDFNINHSQLVDLVSNIPLKTFKDLTIEQIQYNEALIQFNHLVLTDLALLEHKEKDTLLNLAQIELQDFEFNTEANTLNLASVDLRQPDINATLSEQKQLTHLTFLDPILSRFNQAKGAKDDDVEDTQNEEKPGLVINVDTVRLSKPGQLSFIDKSVQPNYNTNLHFNRIEIDQLSSEKTADFSLGFMQGEYTSIDVNGSGLLFNPQQQIHYKVDIKQLDLPPVSAYTTQAMGYGMKSGVVDTIIEGSILDQKIDSNLVLKIGSIEVVETNKETAQEITGASGMSIDLALSTLKDSDDMIDLELPIGGDIKEPDFDLSLIINKAMGIAMKAATMSYLKYALQPFSSVFSLINLASDAANSLSLAPISFAVNDAAISKQQKELLDKVSNILSERPNIKIKACGVSSLKDQQAIQAQQLKDLEVAYLQTIKGKKISQKEVQKQISLLKIDATKIQQLMKDLADKRSANVKAYLIKEKNIAVEKVLNCLSVENLEADSAPLVELVI